MLREWPGFTVADNYLHLLIECTARNSIDGLNAMQVTVLR